MQSSIQSEAGEFTPKVFLVSLNLLFKMCELIGIGWGIAKY